MTEIKIERDISPVRDTVKDKFVVTDSNVFGLYKDLLGGARYVCVVDAGEDSKTLETLERVLEEMAAQRPDRKSTLVTLGGGVVGDLGGFAAAVYMRGINWINVPTTLLAQLDSSIGGKTGVDLKGYKNMVGAFHMPERVSIFTDFLRTLPAREIKCGLGEALKTALLDKNCMKEWDKLPEKFDNGADYFPLVNACARFKESVVSADFKESGRRKILNLGHTVGHALEYLDDHKRSHGEYVAVGLAVESAIGHVLGEIKEDTAKFIAGEARKTVGDAARELCEKYSPADIARAALSDKKNGGGKICVMLSENFGQKEIFLSENEMTEALEKCISRL